MNDYDFLSTLILQKTNPSLDITSSKDNSTKKPKFVLKLTLRKKKHFSIFKSNNLLSFQFILQKKKKIK